jgi:hypothetical protein
MTVPSVFLKLTTRKSTRDITVSSISTNRVAFELECWDREIMSWVTATKGLVKVLVEDIVVQALEKRIG